MPQAHAKTQAPTLHVYVPYIHGMLILFRFAVLYVISFPLGLNPFLFLRITNCVRKTSVSLSVILRFSK